MDKHYLKPCPFCGGSAKVIGGNFIPEPQFDKIGEYIGMGITPDCDIAPACVECEKCHAYGPEFENSVDDKDLIERAVEAWNRRA